nr:unnamed protein product [Digitaria exilis]
MTVIEEVELAACGRVPPELYLALPSCHPQPPAHNGAPTATTPHLLRWIGLPPPALLQMSAVSRLGTAAQISWPPRRTNPT